MRDAQQQRIVGSLVLIGFLSMFQVGESSGQTGSSPIGSPVVWPSFEAALEAAPHSGKMVVIDIFSPTCPWCRKMQAEVYTDPDLQRYLYDTFELGRLDISVNSDSIVFKNYMLTSAELGAGFGATGTPTTIFLEPDGDYITRLPGYHERDEFLSVLQFIGSKSFRDMSFDDYVQTRE